MNEGGWGNPGFKRWSEVLNRENPGRLKGWRVVVKVWNSYCMCGVWSSRTMEILCGVGPAEAGGM